MRNAEGLTRLEYVERAQRFYGRCQKLGPEPLDHLMRYEPYSFEMAASLSVGAKASAVFGERQTYKAVEAILPDGMIVNKRFWWVGEISLMAQVVVEHGEYFTDFDVEKLR